MDILNWLYLAKNKFVRTTLGSAKDLMIFGAKVGASKRGDLYQNYAMSVEDFAASLPAPEPAYKVYTALLTQNGGDDPQSISSGELTIGVSYKINNANGNADFTNVGAPNNNTGTYFIATGTTPNTWGEKGYLEYNTGAPVVTVLENTLGDIWFQYGSVGDYSIWSDNLFTENKTTFSIILMGDDVSNGYFCKGYIQEPNSCSIVTGDISEAKDNVLIWKTPIEIRVYN